MDNDQDAPDPSGGTAKEPTDVPTKGNTWLDTALDKTKRLLEVGSEAADVLVHLQGGVKPLGVAAVGLRVVNSFREHRANVPEEYFGQGWTKLDLGALESNVYQSLMLDPSAAVTEVPGLHEDTPAITVKIDDVTMGFALTGRTKTHGVEPRGCWIPEDASADAAVQRVGRSLWDTLKSSKAVIEPRGKRRGQRLVLVAEAKDQELFSSVKGDEVYARMKKFLEGGYHRSVFLVGEPGVGKSCILRYIASLHGGFVLRLKLSDLGSIDGTTLIRVIEILRPTVLIVDDFDRFVMGSGWREEDKTNTNANAMLDPLEVINQLVPLFMVSANFSESITEALLRPGRFDEPIVIDELDPEIYDRLLPKAPKKIIKELKRVKAPVAFVQELRKRVEVLGWPEATKEMDELVKRSNRVLKLNRKTVRKRRRVSGRTAGRVAPSLVGKSPRQKASLLERHAAAIEKRAGMLINKSDRERVRAEKFREKAEDQRKKAVEHEAEVKARAKPKPKKKAGKKATKP